MLPNHTPIHTPISEGGKRILNSVKDELFPLLEKTKDVMVRIQKIRISHQLNSPRLNELENEYSDIMARFFEVVRKLQTPDILFMGLKQEDTQNIVDYFNYQNAFQKNIEQGLNYVEIIDRTLDRKMQNIQNNRAFLFSILAIIISILSLRL